ncbi:LysR substrate-binding domain-containing protein [Neotabrizicola shimadae]|uniref:LysR family transcriptional regulator n=1 Tax=Neotabrizicola shimadae TaxID=2807096 RepID=A0A8G0ZU76_9RHOB|nr:LysR substrate-binding domain-containing protein [Neotabrizicola shimadae]QYZ71476.1 LysR family transcriptional regulator [Neotabrizicola shimadae]
MPQPQTEDVLQRRGLKLAHLRLIAALADTAQLGLAAARLGTTQPAASRLLAELEQILGHAVHQRSGRGIALTPAGEALARRARKVQIELAETAREIEELAQGGAGHVRIGAVTAPALEIVLPALRTARLSHPALTAEVTVAPSDTLCRQLLAGDLDFVLGRLPTGADRRLLDIRLIRDEPVSLIVRRGHRLLSGAPVRPRDLLAFDWVLPGADSPLAAAVRARLADLGLPDPPQRLSTASFLLTLALVQQTNAIAPLAQAVADQFAGTPDAPYGVVPLDLGVVVPAYGLVTRAGSELTPAAALLARLMMDRIRA